MAAGGTFLNRLPGAKGPADQLRGAAFGVSAQSTEGKEALAPATPGSATHLALNLGKVSLLLCYWLFTYKIKLCQKAGTEVYEGRLAKEPSRQLPCVALVCAARPRTWMPGPPSSGSSPTSAGAGAVLLELV